MVAKKPGILIKPGIGQSWLKSLKRNMEFQKVWNKVLKNLEFKQLLHV